MQERFRSVGANIASSAAGVVCIVSIVVSGFLMVSVIVLVVGKWPSFWWMTICAVLLPVVLIVTIVTSVVGALNGRQLSAVNAGDLRRVVGYLFFPALINLVISVVALMIVLAWFLIG